MNKNYNEYCSAGDCFDPRSNCINRDCWDREGIFVEQLLKHITVDDIQQFFEDNHLFSMVKVFRSDIEAKEFLKNLKPSYCGKASCMRRELYLLDKLSRIGIEIEEVSKLLKQKNILLGNSLEMIEFFRKK